MIIIDVNESGHCSERVAGDPTSTAKLYIYRAYYFNTTNSVGSYDHYFVKVCECYHDNILCSKQDWFDNLSPLDKEEIIWDLDNFNKIKNRHEEY